MNTPPLVIRNVSKTVLGAIVTRGKIRFMGYWYEYCGADDTAIRVTA